MTEQTSIDSLEFARRSLEIRGTISLLDFPRLKDELFSPDGELSYHLAGVLGTQGEPGLKLHVHGKLNLICQRCLGALAYEVDTTTRFVIVPSEDRMPAPEDERDDVDYMVADTHLGVHALIEDEVLLSLPLAPAHENANCNVAMSSVKEQKESPFKVLQGLKLNKE